MRHPGGRTVHAAGWGNGVYEDAEPDLVDPRGRLVGTLDDGLNFVTTPGGRLVVRGGSEVIQTLSAITGNAISDVLNGFRFSPTGAIVVAHSAAASKHYAYAMSDEMDYALPVGSETESGSRVDMTWNTATPGRPHAAELFERLYVVDATLSTATRRELIELKVSAGALVATKPTYDLDASGGAPGAIKAYAIAAFNGVLFVAGWQDESGGGLFEPAVLRHSLLGTDPVTASGFDPDAYLLVGAKGQAITALCPGNSILLVAKEHELYRVTGTGRANVGWQYPIAALDNTLGLGCTNPYALCHAEGFWYGIGRGGPWRSDGSSVESLRSARERSWGRVDSLSLAKVEHHPDRQRILFGFYETGQPSYAEAPFRWWQWDMINARWDVTADFSRSFHSVCAVPFGASQAAAGPPTAVAQSFSFADYRQTKLVGTFTIGDAGAETEVWLRHASQSDVLVTTIDPGLSRFTIDSVVLNYEVCYIKLRHKKAGVYSAFTAEVEFYPRVHAPVVSLDRAGGVRVVTVQNYISNSLVQNLYGDGGPWTKDWLDQAPGNATDNAPSTLATPITVSIEQPAMVGHEESVVNTLTIKALATAVGGDTPAVPTQDLSVELALTTLTVNWQPHNTVGAAHLLQYRVNGSGSGYTTAQSFTQSGLATHSFTITGLSASTKYDVRVTLAASLSPSAAAVMYTKLESPTIAVALGGAGTPDVDVTVTVPASGAGKDVRVYNANETYSNLAVGETAGAHVYTSTAGTCGIADEYFACIVDSSWPTDWTHSDPVSDSLASPCT